MLEISQGRVIEDERFDARLQKGTGIRGYLFEPSRDFSISFFLGSFEGRRRSSLALASASGPPCHRSLR